MRRSMVVMLALAIGWACGEAEEPPPITSGGIVVEPGSLAFGEAFVGGPVESEVTVRNEGPVAVDVKVGSDSAAFSATPKAEILRAGEWVRLKPGESILYLAAFHPESSGAYAGTIRFEGRSGAGATLEVSGAAVSLGIELPPSIDFGRVVIGTTEVIRLEVESRAGRTFELSAMSIGSSFEVTPSKTLLMPNETAIFELRFSPDLRGEVQGQLIVEICRGCPASLRKEVDLVGTGVFQSVDAIPGRVVEFGLTPPGFERSSSFELKNTGEVPVEIGMPFMWEETEIFDVELQGLPTVLEVDEAIEIPVYFRPTVRMHYEAEMVIPLGRKGSIRILFTGMGGGPVLEVVEELDFGRQPEGRMVREQVRVSVRDLSEWDFLWLEDATIEGPDAAAFSVDADWPLDLGDLGRSFAIAYTPGAPGPVEAELVIRTSSELQPSLRVRLRGESLPADGRCELRAIPDEIHLGLAGPSTQPGRLLSLVNDGDTSCAIWDLESREDGGFGVSEAWRQPIWLEPGAAVDTTVFLMRPWVKEGWMADSLLLHHGSVDTPPLEIPVDAYWKSTFQFEVSDFHTMAFEATPSDRLTMGTTYLSRPPIAPSIQVVDVEIVGDAAGAFELHPDQPLTSDASYYPVPIRALFTPPGEEMYAAELAIWLQGEEEAVRVGLLGMGAPACEMGECAWPTADCSVRGRLVAGGSVELPAPADGAESRWAVAEGKGYVGWWWVGGAFRLSLVQVGRFALDRMDFNLDGRADRCGVSAVVEAPDGLWLEVDRPAAATRSRTLVRRSDAGALDGPSCEFDDVGYSALSRCPWLVYETPDVPQVYTWQQEFFAVHLAALDLQQTYSVWLFAAGNEPPVEMTSRVYCDGDLLLESTLEFPYTDPMLLAFHEAAVVGHSSEGICQLVDPPPATSAGDASEP